MHHAEAHIQSQSEFRQRRNPNDQITTVNVLQPGSIDTDMNLEVPGGSRTRHIKPNSKPRNIP